MIWQRNGGKGVKGGKAFHSCQSFDAVEVETQSHSVHRENEESLISVSSVPLCFKPSFRRADAGASRCRGWVICEHLRKLPPIHFGQSNGSHS